MVFPTWPPASNLLPWILAQRKLSLDALQETSNAILSTSASHMTSHFASHQSLASQFTTTTPASQLLQSHLSPTPTTSRLASFETTPTFEMSTKFSYPLLPFGLFYRNFDKNIEKSFERPTNNNANDDDGFIDTDATSASLSTPTLAKRLKMISAQSPPLQSRIELK